MADPQMPVFSERETHGAGALGVEEFDLQMSAGLAGENLKGNSYPVGGWENPDCAGVVVRILVAEFDSLGAAEATTRTGAQTGE